MGRPCLSIVVMPKSKMSSEEVDLPCHGLDTWGHIAAVVPYCRKTACSASDLVCTCRSFQSSSTRFVCIRENCNLQVEK